MTPRISLVGACTLVICGLLVCGCSVSMPTEPSLPMQAPSLVIRHSLAGSRMVTGTGRLEAYAIDGDGLFTNVTDKATWSSSDPQLRAQVSSQPWAFTGPAGHFEVYATYQGLQATLPIDLRGALPFPNLEISLSNTPHSTTIRTGPNSIGAPTGTNTWTSSDEHIAKVDRSGFVSVYAPGNVMITATRDGLTDIYWMSVPPRDRERYLP